MCTAGDQVWSAVIRRDLAANACSSVAHDHERPRSEIVNKVTHTLTCTHARRCPFPWQLKMADVPLMFCLLPVVLIAAPAIVDEASSTVFRKQNAAQVATQRSPWTRFASRTLLPAYSHILTWFERFCSPQGWLGLIDFWLRALERCRRSCTPSTSGTRLKVEKPGSDPQRNCLDWRAHKVWWINSVRKSSGNIFEGWRFSPTVGSSHGGRS